MMRREIIFILVSTCILVIAWVAFGVYHSSVTTTIPDALSTQLEPIAPSFDTATIDALKSRNKVNAVFELPSSFNQTATSSSQTQIPRPTIEPTASPSAGSTSSAQ